MVTSVQEQLCTALNMSADHFGHIQLPQNQAQTQQSVAIKHRRSLEDGLLSRSMDLSRHVTMLFKKENVRASDKRPGTQACYAVFSAHKKVAQSAWSTSEPLQTSFIPDLPLISVANMRGYDQDNRKGTECHQAIVEAYLDGLNLAENDKVVIFDLLPNRYAEFGLALCQRALEGKTPTALYFGVLRADQKDVQSEMFSMAYSHWDGSSLSPPMSRPGWPTDVLSKFLPGSKEHEHISKIKHDFEVLCPAADVAPPAASSANPARAQGSPDFSVDGGKQPLDVTRLLDLQMIANDDFNEP
ncbi:cofG, partial [Symbiodinium sp. CCMP2592]